MTINMMLMFPWMRWMSWLHNRNRRSQTKTIPHFQRRKKKNSDVNEQISSISLIDDVMLLRENIRTVGLELSRSIVSEMLI
ncbi:hypothetical protein Gogos_009990 [Gossypium gossypioides]|uniref:Uncharacterized protein n=1 Tax=Gossypium gossypioides TaxID=34282 RepID=A0A7J9BJU6_GOSGO|nr:hypothetical protein [Gossypium gossypioides]